MPRRPPVPKAGGRQPSRVRRRGWEASENSVRRAVTTNTVCSPISTALSTIRSSDRAIRTCRNPKVAVRGAAIELRDRVTDLAVQRVVVAIQAFSTLEIAHPERVGRGADLHARERGHRAELLAIADAITRFRTKLAQLLGDQIELVRRQSAVVRELDQSKHKSQVPSDRGMRRSDPDQIRARTVRSAAKLLGTDAMSPVRRAAGLSIAAEMTVRLFAANSKSATACRSAHASCSARRGPMSGSYLGAKRLIVDWFDGSNGPAR
jgi:hypothetical protein